MDPNCQALLAAAPVQLRMTMAHPGAHANVEQCMQKPDDAGSSKPDLHRIHDSHQMLHTTIDSLRFTCDEYFFQHQPLCGATLASRHCLHCHADWHENRPDNAHRCPVHV